MTADPIDTGWHLKREIQLTHVIATLSMVVSAVIYIGRNDARIAVVESELLHQRERDERQDSQLTTALTALDKRLERIEDKLDRGLIVTTTKK